MEIYWVCCVLTISCLRVWWVHWTTSAHREHAALACLLLCLCNQKQIFLHFYNCGHCSRSVLCVYNYKYALHVFLFVCLFEMANPSLVFTLFCCLNRLHLCLLPATNCNQNIDTAGLNLSEEEEEYFYILYSTCGRDCLSKRRQLTQASVSLGRAHFV